MREWRLWFVRSVDLRREICLEIRELSDRRNGER